MNDRQYARFMAKVDRTDDCWLWNGAVATDGYGKMNLHYKYASAHRVSYIHHHGTIPEGLIIRHRCRNRHCVNPDHLETGTRVDNMADKLRDGTDNRGEKNHKAKLTAEQVLKIRNRANEVQERLAEEFGVSSQSIGNILSQRTWRHLPS